MLKELGFIKTSGPKAPAKAPPAKAPPAKAPPAKAPPAEATPAKAARPTANSDNSGTSETNMGYASDSLGGSDSRSLANRSQKAYRSSMSRHLLAGGWSRGSKWAKTPEGKRADELYANKKDMSQTEYDRYNRQAGGEQIAHTYDSPMDQAKYETVIQELRARTKQLGIG